jgi:hypothetical protein
MCVGFFLIFSFLAACSLQRSRFHRHDASSAFSIFCRCKFLSLIGDSALRYFAIAAALDPLLILLVDACANTL